METLRPKDKKAKILDVAFKLFRKKGYNATGLNEVLELSSTGKSQLYHYFDSKQDLARHVLQAYAERVLQETATFMNHIESLDEFEKLIDGSLKLVQTNNEICGCLVGSICAELATADEMIRIEISHIFEKWKHLFSKGLTRLQAKGLLRADADTEAIAEHFLITAQGAFLMAKANKDLSIVRKTFIQAIQYIKSYAAT
jgi:TetR/AcrR family transcriptional repressor of nem operon